MPDELGSNRAAEPSARPVTMIGSPAGGGGTTGVTVTWIGFEVMPVKLPSPLYTAVMLFAPFGSDVVENVTDPADTGTVPMGEPFALNVIVPVGVNVVETAGETCDVKVTLSPGAMAILFVPSVID